MITAVDLGVLLDGLVPGAPEDARSEERLAAALREGALVICPTVAEPLDPIGETTNRSTGKIPP